MQCEQIISLLAVVLPPVWASPYFGRCLKMQCELIISLLAIVLPCNVSQPPFLATASIHRVSKRQCDSPSFGRCFIMQRELSISWLATASQCSVNHHQLTATCQCVLLMSTYALYGWSIKAVLSWSILCASYFLFSSHLPKGAFIYPLSLRYCFLHIWFQVLRPTHYAQVTSNKVTSISRAGRVITTTQREEMSEDPFIPQHHGRKLVMSYTGQLKTSPPYR